MPKNFLILVFANLGNSGETFRRASETQTEDRIYRGMDAFPCDFYYEGVRLYLNGARDVAPIAWPRGIATAR